MANLGPSVEEFEHLSADELALKFASPVQDKRVCITNSFQAEDMVVLHLLRKSIPDVPVIFLDTGYHFAETYEYRDRLVREWNLNIVDATPARTVREQESQLGLLYLVDATECCRLRKVEPLARSLEPFDIWFTGLRREQSPSRKNLKKVELHRLPTGKELHKISVLADWDWARVWDYMQAHNIPPLSLYEKGYRSIGCEPCTALPDDPNNPRSGRWGGTKLECGIHTFSEKEK